MSVNLISFPGAAIDCLGRCGALVIGKLYCPTCQALDEELTAKFKQRLFDGMRREDTGLTTYVPAAAQEPDWVADRVMARSGLMLAGIGLASAVVSFGLLYGAWLGLQKVVGLCLRVSA